MMAPLLLVAPPGVHAQDDGVVQVYGVELEDGSVELRGTNNHIIDIYLWVDAPQLINMSSDQPLPYRAGLAPGATGVPLFLLEPTVTSGRRGYSISYSYARGNPETARHDDSYQYLLPFAHGEKHRLSQGFHGRFTHGGENEYAVDFEMPIGTPVYAARGGVVAETKEDSTVGGPSVAYGEHTNHILIQHGDGSFGNYAHLDTDGVIVEPGEIVQSGQIIGYSGNTGRSSGPHLHFDVRLPTYEGSMQSIPFVFRGSGVLPVEPEEGEFYYAYHPGGERFDPVLGSDLSMDDYVGYRGSAGGAEGIEIRVEQVDLTFLVFVQNGLSDDTDVEIEFQLRGLTSDQGTTISLTVPAETEVLATILRPISGATSIQYGYSVRYLR